MFTSHSPLFYAYTVVYKQHDMNIQNINFQNNFFYKLFLDYWIFENMLISIDDRERTTLNWSDVDRTNSKPVRSQYLTRLSYSVQEKLKLIEKILWHDCIEKIKMCCTINLEPSSQNIWHIVSQAVTEATRFILVYPRSYIFVHKILYICTQDLTQLYPRSDYRSWCKIIWLSCT